MDREIQLAPNGITKVQFTCSFIENNLANAVVTFELDSDSRHLTVKVFLLRIEKKLGPLLALAKFLILVILQMEKVFCFSILYYT